MSHRVRGLIVALVASVLAAQTVPLMAARPVAPQAEVAIFSVVPGTLTGDNYWCIGASNVLLTAQVTDVASQTPITEGWIAWQRCHTRPFVGAAPKEACEDGSAVWTTTGLDDLAVNPTNNIDSPVPVLGVRVLYHPRRALVSRKGQPSEALNLDATCGP
jgi:hypothetical protein